MPEDVAVTAGGAARGSTAGRWAAYVVEAGFLVGLLYLFGRHAGSLPPWAVATVWAVLSAASAVGVTYHRVVARTLKQHAYVEKGNLARLNNGRTVCLVVSFVVSAVCMAGLMLEVPTWDVGEWALLAVAVPLYLVVALAVRRVVRGEYKPAFRASRVARWSGAVVAVLLCAAYAALGLLQPAASFQSASEAFLSAVQPFEGSPSALAAEAGTFVALVDGFAAYGTAQAAEVSAGGYLALKVALVASAFCGVASLLGLCSLEWGELKRVFLPLEAGLSPGGKRSVVKRNVVVAVILPVLLVGVYLAADAAVAKASQTRGYTAVQGFVRDQVDLAVFVLDGEYYEYQAVQELREETLAASAALAEEARSVLVPLVNASFDARIANVDGYLDWYYSLPADYERLVTLITGTVEEYVQAQFAEKIEAGVDDSAFAAQLQYYIDQAVALEANFEAQLAAYELVDVPAWLPVVVDEAETDLLPEVLEPSAQLASAGERLLAGASAGAAVGTGAGVMAKKLANKAVEKPFFRVVVDTIAKRLGSKAVGSAVGGAAGSLGGPIGVAVGALVGGAVSVGVDYGMLKLDEAQNREAYRAELVQTIEEARAETLAELGA